MDDKPKAPEPGLLGALAPSYRLHRRQQRIREQLERARNGEHKVPTWALALILVVMLGAWITLIVLS